MNSKQTIKNTAFFLTKNVFSLTLRCGIKREDFLKLKGSARPSDNFDILKALKAIKYTCDKLPTPWNKILLERYLLGIRVKDLRVKYGISKAKFTKENKNNLILFAKEWENTQDKLKLTGDNRIKLIA